jgi:hypothetical protein
MTSRRAAPYERRLSVTTTRGTAPVFSSRRRKKRLAPFALLKAEIGTRRWPDRTTARAEIFTFIETFYNRKRLRRHPVWGYVTPLETRQRHEQEHALAA